MPWRGRPERAEVENEVKQPHWKHQRCVLLQPPSIFVLLHFLFFPLAPTLLHSPWDQLISYASLLSGGSCAPSSYLKSFPARQHGILEIATQSVAGGGEKRQGNRSMLLCAAIKHIAASPSIIGTLCFHLKILKRTCRFSPLLISQMCLSH